MRLQKNRYMKPIAKGLFLILTSLSSIVYGQNVNVEWARSNGGVNNDIGNSITSDSFGNVLVTGLFSDTVDFDPGNGTTILNSAGFSDIFIQKLDADGNFIWAKSIGGPGIDSGLSISCDSLGNSYITGKFTDTVDFDPGASTFELIASDVDVFVLKLDPFGNFVWAKRVGGSYVDSGKSIVVSDSELVVLGSFEASVDFDPGPNTDFHSSLGAASIFILKLDLNGDFIWAKSIGDGAFAFAESLVIGSSGNLFISGQFTSTLDFDPSGASQFQMTSNGGQDFFVLKLDSNGEFIWAREFGGMGNDTAKGISVDAHGNSYITGAFVDIINFDPGQSDISLTSTGYCDAYVLKLDHNGNFIWVKALIGVECVQGKSVSVSFSGDVFVIGTFNYSADFDPGNGTQYLNTNEANDVFILNLDKNGNYVWAGNMGGDFYDEGNSICVSSTGVYATGFFQGTVDFDPSPAPAWVIGNELYEVFTLKLSYLADINHLKAKSDYLIYPNPVENIINIESIDCANLELEIYNIEGLRVFSTELIGCSNSISLKSLKPGFYSLVLHSDKAISVEKIVKQ